MWRPVCSRHALAGLNASANGRGGTFIFEKTLAKNVNTTGAICLQRPHCKPSTRSMRPMDPLQRTVRGIGLTRHGAQSREGKWAGAIGGAQQPHSRSRGEVLQARERRRVREVVHRKLVDDGEQRRGETISCRQKNLQAAASFQRYPRRPPVLTFKKT